MGRKRRNCENCMKNRTCKENNEGCEEWEKMSTRNNMSTKFIKKFQEEWEETTEHLKKTWR